VGVVSIRVEIFDDRNSLIHLACGALSYFWLFVFIVFIFYEIIEHIYKHRKEKEANFLGDIVEFLFGLGVVTLTVKALSGVV